MLIQAVRNRVEARLEPDAAPPRQAQLVFIGYHPSRPRVAEQLRELTGTDWR
ncbi:GTP-binding protein [Ralstonia pseudosolanacearum]|uniref:GTP-binding protein n=1 Tax=Ralstonia pseudosolanacearum TaxID=1310165 RepID=UPI0002D533D2